MPVRSLVVTWITLGEDGVLDSGFAVLEVAQGTWSTPARACWGEPPQLSTENQLRTNSKGSKVIIHQEFCYFRPLDQELASI